MGKPMYSWDNRIITNLLFAAVQYRLSALLFRNRIKHLVKPKNIIFENQAGLAEAFSELKQQGYEKLNMGGGERRLKGFINIDFVRHPNVEPEIVANILDLAFIPDESVAMVHSNHVVEHLTHDQLIQQLNEYRRILKDAGLLSLRCPNALGVSYGFWFEVIRETGHDEFLALGYPEDEYFCNSLDNWYHKNFYGFLHWIFGDVGNIENQHLNRLTPTRLKSAIEGAGFHILKITDPETSNIIIMAQKASNVSAVN